MEPFINSEYKVAICNSDTGYMAPHPFETLYTRKNRDTLEYVNLGGHLVKHTNFFEAKRTCSAPDIDHAKKIQITHEKFYVLYNDESLGFCDVRYCGSFDTDKFVEFQKDQKVRDFCILEYGALWYITDRNKLMIDEDVDPYPISSEIPIKVFAVYHNAAVIININNEIFLARQKNSGWSGELKTIFQFQHNHKNWDFYRCILNFEHAIIDVNMHWKGFMIVLLENGDLYHYRSSISKINVNESILQIWEAKLALTSDNKVYQIRENNTDPKLVYTGLSNIKALPDHLIQQRRFLSTKVAE